MSHRVPCLVALLLIVSIPSLAAHIDIMTGEPIPAGRGTAMAGAPAEPTARDGDLEFLAHIAEGTSKSVRALPGDVVIWQNGAWLLAHDITDPTAPVEISRILLAAQPSDMQVVGSTVYVALRKAAGLLILDYADAANPVTIGSMPGYDLLSVAVGGGRAYCGRGSAGVLVADLTDPTTPEFMTLFDTPGSANGTDIAGDVLYVAMGTSGVGIYNVADPFAPVSLATGGTSGFCTYVQEQAGLAYACDGAGLRIFDVAIPAMPALLSAFNAGGSCYEMCFTADPDIVYLAGLPGLFALEVSDPANPALQASSLAGNAYSCAASDDVALMASRYTGLHLFDSDLASVFEVPNAGFAMKLHIDGDALYVADLSGGVRIYDLSDPMAPIFLDEVATRPNCQDLAVGGGLLYAVNSDNSGAGLTVTDVSDPAFPIPLSEFDTGNQTMGIGVENSLCVLANGFGGLRTVDVADPLAPVFLGDLPFGANATDVVPVGGVAFAVSFGGGMLAVDVSDPSGMSIIHQQFWGFLNALDVTDDLAWVADGQAGLRVVDISDPADLVSIATQSVGGQPRDVVRSPVDEHYVFLADDFYGLRQMDVSDPAVPLLVGSYPSADRGMGVDAVGDLVVLAAGETGVYVYLRAGVVAIEDDQEEIIPELPTSLAFTAAPNPFNPRLEISYSLPRSGSARIDVFDARGRLVRTLMRGNAPAGAGSLIWSGDDATGRNVASGVYHLRLVTEDAVTSRSVTLVR